MINEVIDIPAQLEEVNKLLKGDLSQKNVSRLNTFFRYASKIWMFVDPVTGIAGAGAHLVSDLISDLADKSKGDDKDKIDKIFLAVIKQHEDRLVEMEHKLDMFIPSCSVVYIPKKTELKRTHGASSITENGENGFFINFAYPLNNPGDFFPHCNNSGAKLTLVEEGLRVELPLGTDQEIELKIYLQRMYLTPAE